MKDPAISNFHSNSHHPLSHTVQDLKIIFVIYYDTKWYKLFMNYPPENRKKTMTIVFEFRFVLHSASWFQVIFEKPTFATCYDPIKKMWRSFGQAFLRTLRLDALFDNHSHFFFGTIFAHNFLIFKFCVTIGWTVHSLMLSSSAIILIVKRRSWWMESLLTVDVCGYFHRRSVLITVHLPLFLARLQSLCHRNTCARDAESLPNAQNYWVFRTLSIVRILNNYKKNTTSSDWG
jgi:hypothetical protein